MGQISISKKRNCSGIIFDMYYAVLGFVLILPYFTKHSTHFPVSPSRDTALQWQGAVRRVCLSLSPSIPWAPPGTAGPCSAPAPPSTLLRSTFSACSIAFIIKELWISLGWKGLSRPSSPRPLQWTGSPLILSGCSEPRPTLDVFRDEASITSLGNLGQYFPPSLETKLSSTFGL